MRFNLLKKILSVPNYLSLPVAGIEISNSSIKYVEFVNNNGVLSLKKASEVMLEPNIVKNGDIINKTTLIEALVEVKNNITSDFVKVSIPEEKSYIFDVVLPKEAKNNVREALEFKIEENVPLKLDEVYFEYEIVEDEINSKNIVLSVSVISKKVISDYVELFDKAGLFPRSFEIESKMIANSVIFRGDQKNTIIVNIKDDTTELVAVINGFVRLSSSVFIGENTIRETLLRTGLFKDKISVDSFFENDFSFETTDMKDAYGSLANIFSVLKDEVDKFDGYVTKNFSKKIERIILCGKSSAMPSFGKHINQNINSEVKLADVWINTFDIKESVVRLKFNDSLGFAAPIGLFVSSIKKTNA